MQIRTYQMHMFAWKHGKSWSPGVRRELLIAYTEFTINLEKFISVAGSLYL